MTRLTLFIPFTVAVVALCSCENDADHDNGSAAVARGESAIYAHGCGSCHTIPGIRGADALVGPSLEHVAGRSYLGGVLPNTPENLVRWISDPPAVDPQTAMPNLHLSAADARDVVAYLNTLK
jgi:cytochrome c